MVRQINANTWNSHGRRDFISYISARTRFDIIYRDRLVARGYFTLPFFPFDSTVYRRPNDDFNRGCLFEERMGGLDNRERDIRCN